MTAINLTFATSESNALMDALEYAIICKVSEIESDTLPGAIPDPRDARVLKGWRKLWRRLEDTNIAADKARRRAEAGERRDRSARARAGQRRARKRGPHA